MIRALALAMFAALLLVSCSEPYDDADPGEGAGAPSPAQSLASSPAVADTPAPTATTDPFQPLPPPGFLPDTWQDGLEPGARGEAIRIACLDRDGDGRVSGRDGPALEGLDIVIVEPCAAGDGRRDFFAGDPADAGAFACDADGAPLLVVVVGGGGTDLHDPKSGVSLGLLGIVNEITVRAGPAGVATAPVLASSAVFGADMPQTRMEQWIAHQVAARLDAMPCLRVALIGHSHGGVIVTAVMAALEQRFGGRMFGVVLDRTAALYDRPAEELPQRAPLLNVFQLREGWHGEPIEQANVENADRTASVAPREPRLPGQPIEPVTHVNLDDARDVQETIAAWVVDRAGAD